jgi:hypothetical protein
VSAPVRLHVEGGAEGSPSLRDVILAGFREEAALYRRRGRAPDADLLESVVDEVWTRFYDTLVLRLTEPKPVSEAAAMTGYSASQIYRIIERDQIETWERSGKQVVRPIDLPLKPGALKALLGIAVPHRDESRATERPHDEGAPSSTDRPWAAGRGAS